MTLQDIFPSIAELSDWIGLGLLALVLLAFVTERIAPVAVAVVGAALMAALGYLAFDDLRLVFSNPAPLTIGAMFVLSAALVRTGVIEELASLATNRAKEAPKRSLAELFGGSFIGSAFINNTPIVIILTPVMRRLASVTKISHKRLLIPLSYVTIMGGSLTLIGTSTNLLVDGVARSSGEPAFGIFDLTLIGLVSGAIGFATLLLLGRWLLPSEVLNDTEAGDAALKDAKPESYLTEVRITDDSAWSGKTVDELRALKRSGAQLLGIGRGAEILRNLLEDFTLLSGDRVILGLDQAELLTLAEDHGERFGLSGRAGVPHKDDRVVSASIAPSDPAVGQRLDSLAFLSRHRVRVLGVRRPGHLAGPTLGSARIRPGDHLLLRCAPDAVAELAASLTLIDVDEPDTRSFRRTRAPIAVATLAAIIVLAALGIMPIDVLALFGVAIVLATGCLDPEEAWASIDGNVLVLIFGMLAIGLGLQGAGTVELIVDSLLPLIRTLSPLLVLIILYALTSFLTEVVTNNAVAVLMTPIVLDLSGALEMDPKALLLIVMFGASASFATPIGYQTNTIVYAAGRYRFADFLRIGIPMNVTVGLATCLAIYGLVLM